VGSVSGKRGAETAREAQGARSGQWSLHVSFQGSENVNYRHAAQAVCARTGEYVFQAYARTRDLTMPSWKFDNKIMGEAWLDDVSLKVVH